MLQVREQDLPAKDIDALFGGGGTISASPRERSRTSSEQSRGDELDWANIPPAYAQREPSPYEERGRKRTREEDDVW